LSVATFRPPRQKPHEIPKIALGDALLIVLLMADVDDRAFDRAAVRSPARLGLYAKIGNTSRCCLPSCARAIACQVIGLERAGDPT